MSRESELAAWEDFSTTWTIKKKTWRRGRRNKNKSHICTQNSDKMEARTAENPGKRWGKEETPQGMCEDQL